MEHAEPFSQVMAHQYSSKYGVPGCASSKANALQVTDLELGLELGQGLRQGPRMTLPLLEGWGQGLLQLTCSLQ